MLPCILRKKKVVKKIKYINAIQKLIMIKNSLIVNPYNFCKLIGCKILLCFISIIQNIKKSML